MNLTYHCPRCQHHQRVELEPLPAELVCGACGQAVTVPAEGLVDGQVRRCLVCPSTDLFVRKDFPQRLGVAIVVLGFIASSFTWGWYWTYTTFGILFLVAGIDVVLYLFVGNSLMCYRCGAEYRGVRGLEQHGPFELETHEKHRQQQARLAQQGALAAVPSRSQPDR